MNRTPKTKKSVGCTEPARRLSRLYMVMGDSFAVGDVKITAALPATLMVEHPADWAITTYIDEPRG